MTAKKNTKTAPKKKTPAPDIIDAGGGILVEIAPPTAKKKTKPATETKSKKMSALDAAAKVLAEAGEAMTCQEMIEAMAAQKLWTSPGGKTPSQTLYSAILREVAIKGNASRFQKTERGKFARTQAN